MMENGKSIKYLVFVIIFTAAVVVVQGCSENSSSSQNQSPKIIRIETDTQDISTRHDVFVSVLATDPDGDKLEYSWSSNGGTFLTGGASNVPHYSPTTNPAKWLAPKNPGEYKITCVVSDGIATAKKSITVQVKQKKTYRGNLKEPMLSYKLKVH
jgi:hypothetical protein